MSGEERQNIYETGKRHRCSYLCCPATAQTAAAKELARAEAGTQKRPSYRQCAIRRAFLVVPRLKMLSGLRRSLKRPLTYLTTDMLQNLNVAVRVTFRPSACAYSALRAISMEEGV